MFLKYKEKRKEKKIQILGFHNPTQHTSGILQRHFCSLEINMPFKISLFIASILATSSFYLDFIKANEQSGETTRDTKHSVQGLLDGHGALWSLEPQCKDYSIIRCAKEMISSTSTT